MNSFEAFLFGQYFAKRQLKISHENIYWTCSVVPSACGLLAAGLSDAVFISNCMASPFALSYCWADNWIVVQSCWSGFNVPVQDIEWEVIQLPFFIK